jgi:hypothetical protein
MKMVWERIQYLLPSAAWEIQTNHCQKCFNYSYFKFKSCLGKHQDNEVLANEKSRLVPGTIIVSISFNHNMNFKLYSPLDEQTNEAKHTQKR